ncbi:hypothetical protein HMN09_01127400 [Mycena chlorophos]|uniref:Ricin B lectin domain-containing protein n=1 Tax=Mycena chlorophos TaxID=658473 RepID=A0A8H6SCJ6_MYCCL|nr:hypothetical protein HMN09_01127400 [Mycena chlorophos]
MSAPFFALVASALVLSAQAIEFQSNAPAFASAGIQGCMSATSNENGAPVVIHNCANLGANNTDWTRNQAVFTNPNLADTWVLFGDKCLDVTNGVAANGTKLQLWECTKGDTNQGWVLKGDDAPYQLQFMGTNLCLDLTNGVTTDGNQLQLWECIGDNTNQGWNIESDDDTTVVDFILTPSSSLASNTPAWCIVATEDTDGAEVAIVDCENFNANLANFTGDFREIFPAGNITWTLPANTLSGPISTYNGKYCLDVTNGDTTNGNRLQVWSCVEGSTNQQFKRTTNTADGGNSQISWVGTSKCLDLTGGSTASGNPIQIWDCSEGNDNQSWKFGYVVG